MTSLDSCPASDKDRSQAHVVLHNDGAAQYIKGFGGDRKAAEEHAEQMGTDYYVKAYDAGAAEDRDADRRALMAVQGITSTRADALLDTFGSLYDVSSSACKGYASIAEVDGISMETAAALFDRMVDAGVYVGSGTSVGVSVEEARQVGQEEFEDKGVV